MRSEPNHPVLFPVPSRFDPTDFCPTIKTRLLILQPTPFCNVDCTYCYLPNRDSTDRMTLDLVRQATQRLCEDDLVGDTLAVVWHAGEPLAVPISFYEMAMPAIHEIVGNRVQTSHSIQTNATLITDAWCDLFKKYDISVGVSVDGPAHLHNRNRRTRLGKPTHQLVMRGIECLRAQQIPFHAIAVVTAPTLAEPDAFFDFFLHHGIREVGCNYDETEGCHTVSSITGKEDAYRAFLERLHERSLLSNGQVIVRELEYAYNLISEGLPRYHWRNEVWPENAQVMPFVFVTVGCNGDFSTFSPELLGQRSLEFRDFVLGNVRQSGFLASVHTKTFRKMWNAVLHGIRTCQQSCAYFDYCGGGSPANKFYENSAFSGGETLYCRATVKNPLSVRLDRFCQ